MVQSPSIEACHGESRSDRQGLVLRFVSAVCLMRGELGIDRMDHGWRESGKPPGSVGAPGTNRTCDPPLRRGMLYPCLLYTSDAAVGLAQDGGRFHVGTTPQWARARYRPNGFGGGRARPDAAPVFFTS